jgi:hypothetical protein
MKITLTLTQEQITEVLRQFVGAATLVFHQEATQDVGKDITSAVSPVPSHLFTGTRVYKSKGNSVCHASTRRARRDQYSWTECLLSAQLFIDALKVDETFRYKELHAHIAKQAFDYSVCYVVNTCLYEEQHAPTARIIRINRGLYKKIK